MTVVTPSHLFGRWKNRRSHVLCFIVSTVAGISTTFRMMTAAQSGNIERKHRRSMLDTLLLRARNIVTTQRRIINLISVSRSSRNGVPSLHNQRNSRQRADARWAEGMTSIENQPHRLRMMVRVDDVRTAKPPNGSSSLMLRTTSEGTLARGRSRRRISAAP